MSYYKYYVWRYVLTGRDGHGNVIGHYEWLTDCRSRRFEVLTSLEDFRVRACHYRRSRAAEVARLCADNLHVTGYAMDTDIIWHDGRCLVTTSADGYII